MTFSAHIEELVPAPENQPQHNGVQQVPHQPSDPSNVPDRPVMSQFQRRAVEVAQKKAAAAANAAAKQRGRKSRSKRASAAQPVGPRSVHVKCEEVDQTLSLSPLTGVEVAVPFGERVGLLKSEDSD